MRVFLYLLLFTFGEIEMRSDFLRPFNLEAAKRGDEICDVGGLFCVYIDGPDNLGHVAVKCSGNLNLFPKYDLRMRPLAWVEDRPVYKGDVLYSKLNPGAIRTVTCTRQGMVDTLIYFLESEGHVFAKDCTWTKPEPVKKTRTVKFLAWLLPNGHLVNIAEDAAKRLGYKRVPSEDKTVEVEL